MVLHKLKFVMDQHGWNMEMNNKFQSQKLLSFKNLFDVQV
jgi:hypothetical protein